MAGIWRSLENGGNARGVRRDSCLAACAGRPSVLCDGTALLLKFLSFLVYEGNAIRALSAEDSSLLTPVLTKVRALIFLGFFFFFTFGGCAQILLPSSLSATLPMSSAS